MGDLCNGRHGSQLGTVLYTDLKLRGGGCGGEKIKKLLCRLAFHFLWQTQIKENNRKKEHVSLLLFQVFNRYYLDCYDVLIWNIILFKTYNQLFLLSCNFTGMQLFSFLVFLTFGSSCIHLTSDSFCAYKT